MMHSIDRHGKITGVNDYWLMTMGYQRSEVIGRRSTEFLTEASRDYAIGIALPEFFRAGYAKDVEYQMVKKNGDVIDVLLTAVSQRDDSGEIIRSLAVITDLTERKRMEEEDRIARGIPRAVEAHTLVDHLEGALLLAKTWNEPDLVRRLGPGVADQVKTEAPEVFTNRELEVLQLLAWGLSNKEIADRLLISIRTVRFHTENLYRKLQVGSRTRAVWVATRRGLLNE